MALLSKVPAPSRVTPWVLAAAGWIAAAVIWQRPVPTKIETVEKIKYVDRVYEKTAVRETTKPDGTKVVERIVTNTVTKTQAAERIETKIRPELSKYSIGASVGTSWPLEPVYGLEVGYRIGETPLWTALEVNSSREIFAKLRFEF